jgi:hypothetical protein
MRRAPIVLLLLASACAAIGSSGEGDVDLPTTGVGPFRKLDGDETLGVAPYLLDDRVRQWHDPAVLPVDPASPDPEVFLYLAGTAPQPDGTTREVIARTRADDGRSFFGADIGQSPRVVVTAARAEDLARAPSVARIKGRIVLYWSDGHGIKASASDDGLTFSPPADGVYALGVDPGVLWERTPPGAPSVFTYPDGRIRMMYAAGGYIGEAESEDGVTFRRIGVDPVFGPSAPVDPSTLAIGEKPPFDTNGVFDPCVLPRVTPAGRLQVRVLYTGLDASGATSIGFAARYGDQGPLVRQVQAVYAVGKREAAPALFEWSGGALLYVSQDREPTPDTHSIAIAAAYAPANRRLPAATTFADSP